MKKKLSFVLALVIFCSTFAFSGCSLIEKLTKKENYVEITFIWSVDNSIVYEVKETFISRTSRIDIEVPGRIMGTYTIIVKEVYGDTELEPRTRTCEPKLDSTFAFPISHVYDDNNPIKEHTYVRIKFVEYRVTPTIILDPNGAIEYTESERYVYKYDGQSHLPSVLHCVHEGQILSVSEYRRYLYNTKTDSSMRFDELVDVGTYILRYTVVSSAYLDAKYQNENYCAPTHLFVTVEIIE